MARTSDLPEGCPALVLASASPRRLDLLRQIGVTPDRVAPADMDETPGVRELPVDHARRLAREKADAVAVRGQFTLAADTVVACGRRILPKPDDAAGVRACLRLLSGRRHRVHTGVCVIAPDGRRALRVVTTLVQMARLTDAMAAAYIASGEGQGKAGGYAIQGRAARFVTQISGSYTNVVGLPVWETAQMLMGLGYPVDRPPTPAAP
ncbi:MAG: septum formation protein Maf [Rhodospirillaceae bacterium]|nr:septum formation protein Maf [Rhodospirillaceae bacterium]